LAVVALPVAARRLPWRALLAVSVVASAAWAVSLALVDGGAALGRPIATAAEYLADVPRVHGLHAFLSGFTEHITVGSPGFAWVTHVSGHPPGALLAFVGLDRLGLAGRGWAAALRIGAGACAAAAALSTLRVIAGEAAARRAAPYLATAPAAVWIATSADALFLGVSAWGIALLALAAAAGHPRRAYRDPTIPGESWGGGCRGRAGADVLALGGGVLLGLTVFLSYGLVLLAPIAVAVVVAQKRIRPLVVGAVAVAVVVAMFAALGFWWLDGLSRTRIRYQQGSASARPYLYFLFANLAVLGLTIGPAGVAALAWLGRHTALLWLPAAALIGILLADLSGLSKSEVERIWLPFTPWLLAATALLPQKHQRWWLAAQLSIGLAVQTLVRTNW
ncbi:MAG: hypothetical protein M3O87_01270, partial [Candidatus Dormibacteraeota bacterium]|nr:hypothetical protein [Candidatus Dormibacteraeota bacterium]